MPKRTPTTPDSVNSALTKLVKEIESGNAPWQKPWKPLDCQEVAKGTDHDGPDIES